MNKPGKEVKEHIARAKAYAGRFETLKALASAREAVRLLAAGTIFGRERFEIDILLAEVVRSLDRSEDLRKFYSIPLTYAKGKERELYKCLSDAMAIVARAKEIELKEATRARKNRIDQLVLKAQELLDQNTPLEAKKVIRMLADQYPDEPGLYTDLGLRMSKAGLLTESVEYLEQAIEREPKDPRAYVRLVDVHENLGRTDEAVQLLQAALRVFGNNPRLLVRLARLHKEARRWAEAYDAARAAAGMDPHSKEVLDILACVEPKIFG